MPPVKQAPRRYVIELGLAFVLYLAALFGRVYAAKAALAPNLATVITLSPIVPILLIGLVVTRFYRRIDEFQRTRMLKVAAISCGLTAIATAIWSFLTDVGAPPLANYGVLLLLAGMFLVVGFLYRVEDAAAERRIGQLARILSWLAAFLATIGGVWLAVACLIGLAVGGPLVMAVPGAVILVCVSLRIGPSTGFV